VIPRDYITSRRAEAPWVQDIQVEQDLVICRALVELFANPILANALAFRGGTALYKLYIKPAARYSEDIDLVQMSAEPAGPVMEAIRSVLDPWLGAPPLEADRRARNIRLSLFIRRHAADRYEAESRNQHTRTFRGPRFQNRPVQRVFTVV
jgi:predicted nucleotidyltransferase component of viral defense system